LTGFDFLLEHFIHMAVTFDPSGWPARINEILRENMPRRPR
jgi:hypothetical protein